MIPKPSHPKRIEIKLGEKIKKNIDITKNLRIKWNRKKNFSCLMYEFLKVNTEIAIILTVRAIIMDKKSSNSVISTVNLPTWNNCQINKIWELNSKIENILERVNVSVKIKSKSKTPESTEI